MNDVQIKSILCPVDFSDASIEAAHFAAQRCRETGASLALVYAIKDPGETYITHNEKWGVEMEVTEGKHAQAQMEDLAKNLKVEDLETEVITGRPGEVILEEARTRGVDLIIMSTTGRSGLSRVFMGSVAEKVARGAECMVTLCKKREG